MKDMQKLCKMMICCLSLREKRNSRINTNCFINGDTRDEDVSYMKEMNAEMLNNWLQRFVLEVRNHDGSE